MLLARFDVTFQHRDWIFEPRLDGFRAVAYVEDVACQLVSRNRNAFKTFEPLAQAIGRQLSVRSAILDGEIVRPGPDGRPMLTTQRGRGLWRELRAPGTTRPITLVEEVAPRQRVTYFVPTSIHAHEDETAALNERSQRVVLCFGPSHDSPSRFDVVSIKPSARQNTNKTFRLTPDGGFRAGNYSLKDLIRLGWDVRNFQITGGPGWLDTERYNVQAKPDVAFSPLSAEGEERQRQMVRSMLHDRFRLQVHLQQKEMNVYDLVLA